MPTEISTQTGPAVKRDAPAPPRISSVMSETAYDTERSRLRGLYGDGDVEALAKRDQALALLFARSGWTQEKLAEKEGKDRTYIARRLCFGRFLNFVPIGTNDVLPANLTEGRFRSLWEQTEKAHKDEIRFRDVLKLLHSAPVMMERRPQIGPKIRDAFADGKWHTAKAIAEKLDLDQTHVSSTLDNMIGLNGSYGCKAERKRTSTGSSYRVFKQDRVISAAELLEKLTPIITELRAEGRASAATASPAAVAILAGKLQKLLDEWTQ